MKAAISGSILDDDEKVTQTTAYGDRRALWKLDLVQEQIVRGAREDIDGHRDADAMLRHRTWTYDDQGRVVVESDPAVTPSTCAGVGADRVVRRAYDDVGLLAKVTQEGRAVEVLETDDTHLYSKRQRVTYDATVRGRPASKRQMEETVDVDLRHGGITSRTDPNGHTWTKRFDSRGREVEARGPNNVLLTTTEFDDVSIPNAATTTTWTAVNKSFITHSMFDGAGRLLAEVVRSDVVASNAPIVRRTLRAYDAFGRLVESALPREASSIDDVSRRADERALEKRRYDGFDRLVEITRPDGHKEFFDHTPRSLLETNARGYSTLKELDGHGNVLRITRVDEGFTGDVAVWEYGRDGLGC